MREVDDAELVERIGAGDPGAVASLYDRHASVLFPIALRILRDRAEAEDVIHDAFVTLHERSGQYQRDKGSVIAWLVTLVRNASIDRARRRERRSAITHEVVAFEPPVPTTTPEEQVAAQSDRQRVLRALARLPQAQLDTLKLAFYTGLSYPEIAEREGVPLGTIKSRAARALTGLRAELEREGLDMGAFDRAK